MEWRDVFGRVGSRIGLALATLMVLGAAPSPSRNDWGDQVEGGQTPLPGQMICRAVRDLSIPAAHVADARRAAAGLRGCDAEALYYGIGREPDPLAARRCAILSRQGGEPRSLFDGDELLMTIYANGQGAARNLDLAIHLACGLQAAPFEHEGRIATLTALKSSKDRTPFHYCQDITSGYAMGWCARHSQRFAIAQREDEVARLTSRLSPTGRKAFDALWSATLAYAEARAQHETDLSGTARGAFAVETEEAVWGGFMDLLKRVAGPRPPAGDLAQARVEDAALNTAYRKRMAASFEDLGSINSDGVRQAERAWVRYRDAWLTFVRAAYPNVSADGVHAHLTRERTKVLETLGEG